MQLPAYCHIKTNYFMKIYTELYLNRNCKSDNFFSEKCDNVSEDVAFVHDSKTTVLEITAARDIGWLKVSDTVSANSEKTFPRQ